MSPSTPPYNVGRFHRDYDEPDSEGQFDIPDLEMAQRIAIDNQHLDTWATVIFDSDGIPIEAHISGFKFLPVTDKEESRS